MANRIMALTGLAATLAVALGSFGEARAACVVDSLDTTVRERAGRRLDVVRYYVDSGAPDCLRPRLTHAGAGTVVGARARVVRGDTPNARFGSDHLFWTGAGGRLEAYFALPGLRTGDIVVLEVERSIDRDHSWAPDSYGVPGWASLRWKGPAEPTEANVPVGEKGWFVEREVIEAAGGGLQVQFGSPPVGDEASSPDGKAELTVQLVPEASTPPGEAPLGETRVSWRIPIGDSGTGAIGYPADAQTTVCQVEGSPEALLLPTNTGCVVREAAPGAALIAEWTLPRIRLAGEVGPGRRAFVDGHANGGGADSGSLPWAGSVGAVGPIDVRLEGSGVSFRAQVLDPERQPAVAGDGAVRFTVPGTPGTGDVGVSPVAGWWVTAIHGQPLLANRDALLQVVARTALAASVPEPGLPARIRLRSGEASMIPEIQALVREQVRVGAVPGDRSLQARKLLDARKSTYASEWELALMTARYLRQIRLDALPIPVRPAHLAPAESGMPAGYVHAVVRVRRSDGSDLWLDPACAVCAEGELRPALWGAEALAEELQMLPPAPTGRMVEVIEIRSDGNQRFVREYVGTAALHLRLELLAQPSNARIAWLEAELGGTLDKHEGLSERGATIRLEGARPGVLDPLPPHERLRVPESAYVRVPWRGERIREVRVPGDVADVLLAPALEAEVVGMGLRYTRTLGVEGDGTRVTQDILTIDEAVLSRDSMIALRDRMKTTSTVVLPVPEAQPPVVKPASDGDGND